MSLAVGKGLLEIEGADFAVAEAAIERWQTSPASAISHHGRACCDVAREWVLSTDYSQLGGGSLLAGPRWIRQRYTWGPSSWPMHWCEAVRRKTLDCGALAALAREVFNARGVRCLPAQFVQRFSREATRDWELRWREEEGAASGWMMDDIIYHEGCAVVTEGDALKVWDASAGWWFSPRQSGGYGAVLALRVFDTQAAPETGYRWGAHSIAPNSWQKLGRARGDLA